MNATRTSTTVTEFDALVLATGFDAVTGGLPLYLQKTGECAANGYTGFTLV